MMVNFLNAQIYELGKVSKEELEEKIHPIESDAVAAVLYEKGSTKLEYSDSDGDFRLVTEIEVRIKIYKKEGYDWANKIVNFYTANNPKESVEFSKAVTYNLVDGQIKKTKIKNEGEFEEQINKFWSQKKIIMPNIKEGSVIEYKYIHYSPYKSNFPKWSFQSTIPVNYSKYTTVIPEYFVYNSSFRGYVFPKKEQKTQQKTLSITSKNRSGFHVSVTKVDYEKITFNEHITSFVSEKVPAIKDEEYVGNINNYISSVEHELATIKYPNSIPKNYSLTWDDVVKNIYDSDDFGSELKKNGYFENDVTALLSGINSEEEKISVIFNYVKNRMNWNDYTSYNTNDGVRKAYKDKVGNVAEINLMLTAMLRFSGINANPVLVSTRSNGIAIFPNRTAYNYIIAAVEVKDDLILLDATDKNAIENILPIRALNWQGRLIRENGSSTEVDLMPKSNSKDIINIVATLDKDGKFVGKARDQYFDYNAFVYRYKYNNISKENHLDILEKRYSGIEINDYETVNDKLYKPVIESYSFSHNSISEIIGDKIYFSPFLFFTENDNPFKQEKREYPVDFIFPHQNKYSFTITIPQGYTVESFPQPLALGMNGNLASFKFNISVSGDKIQIISSLDINSAIIPQSQYEILKNFYAKVIEKQNEKVVLRKV